MFLPHFQVDPFRSSAFLWARVFRNREHHTLLGLAATEIFLILMTFL